MREALILVDVQNDFCPGGALAVPEGDRILPVVNALQERFEIVVATQDWHPADHLSFASRHGRRPGAHIRLGGLRQTLWPDHCVQGSRGAEFEPTLRLGRIARVFRKGEDRAVDSYSGFFDNGGRRSTGLAGYLRTRGVTDVCVAGLATDYCVKYTVLDACRLGFRVRVVEDACRGVNLRPGDSARALEEMRRAGATVVRSEELLRKRPRAAP
jgi:nicotinamidase/pyrazinamidase